MAIQKNKEAFEKWFKTTGFYENAQDSAIYNEAPFDVFNINNGFYRNHYVQLSWETWQAATALSVTEGFVLIPTIFPESKAQIFAEQKVEAMSKRIDDKFRGGLEFSDEKKAHLIRMNTGEQRQIFRDFFKMMSDLELLNDSP